MELKDAIPVIGAVSTASGYLAIIRGRYTRLRASALAWEQRIFESVLVGALLLAIARLAVVVELHYFPKTILSPVFVLFKLALPIPFSATMVVTVVLCLLAGSLQNMLIRPRYATKRVVEQFGSARQMLLLNAVSEHQQVLIELKNGRLIVGYVDKLPEFDRRPQIATFGATMFGSRNSDGHMELTRSYLGELLSASVGRG